MSTNFIAALLIWISATTGWMLPNEMPTILQGCSSDLPHLRGYTQRGVIHLCSHDSELEAISTLVHELVHYFQFSGDEISIFDTCNRRHQHELQAYDIEDIFRKERGLEPTNRIGEVLSYINCIEGGR